ncbi:MAG: putative toxin-antitoxin system toxin component, PIN family [Candidatus Tectimicrobiota bacterium]
MPRIVLDSTVLVSAFIAPHGAAAAVLGHVRAGRVDLILSEAILQETARVLLTSPHIRDRYHYPDSAVHVFCTGLAQLNRLLTDIPPVSGVCRDPNDDMVLACAVAAGATYLVARDKDLLALQQYIDIPIVTPEVFLTWLRSTLP